MNNLDEVLLKRIKSIDSDQENEDDSETKDEFIRGLFQAVLLGTRASNAIPSGGEEATDGQQAVANDYTYQSIFPEFKKKARSCGNIVLELLQIFVNHVQPGGEFSLADGDSEGGATDPEAFESLADVVDRLLEDVEGYVDAAAGGGAQRQVALVRGQLGQLAATARQAGSKYQEMVANVADLPKPQAAWAHEVDNGRDAPFVPRLRDKPHAVAPLDLTPVPYDPEVDADDEAAAHYGMRYPHPYEAELREFTHSEQQLRPPGPDRESLIVPSSHVDAPYTWVDTEAGLGDLLAHLLGQEEGGSGEPVAEVALDLEHHSFRSFQGVTCLMQLSTRERDYLIDALAVREWLPRLLPVLADPRVVKVLHGADSDVLWLQRDFGLYVVNLFDTGQAARALGLPAFSLAYLLQRYCGLSLDKKHQLSDWRQRPLPAEMAKYAQADTHYLLHAYDLLRLDLEAAGDGGLALRGVLDAGRELCLRRYEKEPFRPGGYEFLVQRAGGPEAVTAVQRRVLAALWDWRDRAARRRDESVGYVAPGQVLLRVSQHLPGSADQLRQCGNPLPPLVQEGAAEVLRVVREAVQGRPAAAAAAAAAAPAPVAAAANNPRAVMPPAAFRPLGGPGGNGGPSPLPFSYTPSVAQASLIGAARGSPSPVTLGSPVPDAEELYRLAGWTTPVGEGPLEAAGLAVAHGEGDEQDGSGHGGGQGEAPPDLDLGPLGEEGLDEQEMMERIREEIAREPLFCLAEPGFQVEGEPSSGRAAGEALPTDSGGEGGEGPPGAAGSKGSGRASPEAIPQSMAEIYKISNRNRKKNKEKKKLREVVPMEAEGAGLEEPDDDDEDDGGDVDLYFETPEDGGGKKAKAGDGPNDTLDFMETIGWVKPDEREGFLAAQRQDGAAATGGGTGGSAAGSRDGSDQEGPPPAGAGAGGGGAHGWRQAQGPSPGRRGGKAHGQGKGERRQSGKESSGGGYNEQRAGGRGRPGGFQRYDYSATHQAIGAYGSGGGTGGGSGSGGGGQGGGTAGGYNPYLAAASGGGGKPQKSFGGSGGGGKGVSGSGWRNRPDPGNKDRGKSMTFSSSGGGKRGGSGGSQK